MKSSKFVYRETSVVALGQAICTAIMFGVFALLGKFDPSVLWGGLVGMAVSVGNFFFMALIASLASDKAQQQDVTGGQKMIQLSYMGRMIVLFLILALCAKSGRFHVVALVVPLVFTRPVLTIREFFTKKGDAEV